MLMVMLMLPLATSAELGRKTHALTALEASAPLRVTVVLASDAQRTDSCALTAQSLRERAYNGSIHYVTELSLVPATTLQTLLDAKVDVLDLQTLLNAAHTVNNSWVAETPHSCKFSGVYDVLRIPDTEKRSKGWRGYYLKTLAAFTSYWRHPAGFDRVLYVDCGARALASQLTEFFTEIDSAGRLLAERDADEFTDPAFTALGLSSQFLSQCNQSAYGELKQRSGGTEAGSGGTEADDALLGTDYFNDAMARTPRPTAPHAIARRRAPNSRTRPGNLR
jgi:hypothetical protein